MRNLILGIGSPFADDQVGWLVAEKLRANSMLQAQIEQGQLQIEIADRPGLNLLYWLQDNYQHLYLIDMVKTNCKQVGTLYKLTAPEIIGFSGMLSSHSLGVAAALALAEVLAIKIDHVTLWGIEGQTVEADEQMNSQISLAAEKVCREIVEQVTALTDKCN